MARLQNSDRFKYQKANTSNTFSAADNTSRENTAQGRINQVIENIRLDSLYGFHTVTDVKERTGYLLNMHSTEIMNDDKRLVSGVDYYFLEEDGTRFKVSVPFRPYFYILCRKGAFQEVSTFLLKKYNTIVTKIEIVEKEDLDMPNHLIGLKQTYLKLLFANITDLMKVKRDIMAVVRRNVEREKNNTYYSNLMASALNAYDQHTSKRIIDHMDNILDIREHDIPHHVRVSIDAKIFVGTWYTVRTQGVEPPIITRREDIIETIEPIVLAYDIETTKLPLKFPDANSDQIMMISYMIDGEGYLITNRDIVSSDINDFEYTPKPEFEGVFTIFNEPDEKATIRRFFDHINEVKPHVFVTYNGDFFDWPFVETRAAIHNLDMKTEIGFAKNRDGVYANRAAIHMDCLCWVRRDSYLPVGSHGLKAVAKAKLRYDPVELDPEDMCKMAAEDPQTLASYSVSDAVATYYLYQKYIHPFIFALCTIIPMEPDEVLRKGSGTLCESLLMVQAFQANVIFPNKQESEFNKLTKDGHVLDQETYVGGHVEALESGVFRADIPCRFKLVPEAVDILINNVENTLKHAIEEEEKVPLDMVSNFDEVADEIRNKLVRLKEQPFRVEKPVIYHLDVGAMYPNIILTNRLQPFAIVNETVCASCDYNRPNALCQKQMQWTWRGECMSAGLGEFQRIQQQLEMEKFPSLFPNGPRRAFHQLSKQDKAAYEKKRLTEYCRKVYKKVKVTRTEVKTETVCQQENSFYVDTVRAFRDRRYEYKGLTKVAKQQVAAAIASGDAGEIKSAKNREVLYDSLQLAHKCILNSFYGYVMRKGARWHSMEMAGIVCYTGAHIIMKAREIIEQIGRPLELDTDGIWCILPASFPDNVIVKTQHPKKSKLTISYPNTVLNFMVKDQFTNHVYHELTDPENVTYKIRSENSIFFEVDGPYLAMVLPAAKEEGKKLKKRYAVFNFDGSLAELKGFEVKRRGELQLIKIFQSSVFESFLKGNTLEECYQSVAKVADYWLDVLYSKGANIPDSDLLDLISENKSMSRKLDDYGAQKSTSISTAKRLAEFLGDQMVKDAGLACKYIVSRKPEGSPVTERAIPLAIFQSEPSVKKYYLRKWLKDNSLQNFDIREVLDWNYYIERLGSTIQKIITIPAAMQGISNPVPRVKHPDWLHKKIMEKTDTKKQQKITEMFTKIPKSTADSSHDSSTENTEDTDIEDVAGSSHEFKKPGPVVSKRKRDTSFDDEGEINTKSWREVLGDPPPMGKTAKERLLWLEFQKKKWAYQTKQRGQKQNKRSRTSYNDLERKRSRVVRDPRTSTVSGFLRHAQRKLLSMPWQIIQLAETNEPGMFRLWVLVDQELHHLRLVVPRIFYINSRKAREESQHNSVWKKCSRTLPRSRKVYHLYQCTVPEAVFIKNNSTVMQITSKPEIEGIYETQISLEFRAILQLGCVCSVDKAAAQTIKDGADTFNLLQLRSRTLNEQPYLQSGVLKHIFLYHHWSSNRQRAMWGLFLAPIKKGYIFVVDTVRTDQMPNMNTLYVNERNAVLTKEAHSNVKNLPDAIQFEVKIEINLRQVYRMLQAALMAYKNDMKGATVLIVQSPLSTNALTTEMPGLTDFPLINTHVRDIENLYGNINWQRDGAKIMVQHYLNSEKIIELTTEQCRFFHAPIGNLPVDATLFGADLFYARHLQKHNFVLWCSPTEMPDLGGSESDDCRLQIDFEEISICTTNSPGTYSSVCMELEIESLAINALLQSHHVNDIDGTSSFVAFHSAPQISLQETMSGEEGTSIPSYDQIALCAPAFKVLKSMVSAWLRDVTEYRNMFADYQIIHFHRWLRSPNALLYDPALWRTLYSFMKKLFLQLLAEFKKLGSIIVFANFNKIILCTKKRIAADALGYVEFVVSTIRNKELFHSIEITCEQCWEYLIWLDLPNHAGVRGKLPGRLENSQNDNSNDLISQIDENEDEDDPKVVMNWNIMEYLPTEAFCQASFRAVIAGYITAIYQHMCNSDLDEGISRPNRRNRNSASQILGLGALESTAAFAKKLLSGEISQKLFQIVQKIHRKLPEKELTIQDNPNFDLGDHEKVKINPALELVKSVCKVLSLDKEVEQDVCILKANLLRLINISSFSDEAEWRDPCISLVLPEVICKACYHTRSIDLCKDSYRDKEDNKYVWKCPLCETSYDNAEIEFSLLDLFYRKSTSYTLQDLQCRKCLEIKRENMNEICTCAGEFKTTYARRDLLTFARTLRSIAVKFQMNILVEAIKSTKLFIQTDIK
ncbi:DNA polymerase epsilon catalytic subunit A [Orussus abietinus]|uniref:DNA polymerase epsilon catalytic subunit A n=1 Tax=Orussus abietinus TaxID=222816 RepID=UPI000626A577|nr:DNA polymerase epsilon catalytic subunit A [Orussus abietinus]